MSAPTWYGPNRLRSGTVSAGSTVATFPLSRLWDGFAALLWEGTGPIVLDQGATVLDYDAAIFGAGHNLGGATLTVTTDDNPGFSSPTTLGSAVAPTATAFAIACPGTVERYSAVSISGGPATMQLGELFLAPSVTAPRPPTLASAPNRVPNYVSQDSEAGVWLATIRGLPRWTADWIIPLFPRTLRTSFLAFWDAVDAGGQACFLMDDEDTLRFVQVVDMKFSGGPMPQNYEGHFTQREALA